MLVRARIDKSPIHGLGLFSVDALPEGTKVWEFTPGYDQSFSPGDIDPLSEASKEQFFNYAYTSKITGNYILCTDDARFFNHDPNSNITCTVPEDSTHPEALVCYTTRDVSAGEEITNDYREFDSDPSDVM